jgi:hypothetical protein
VPPTLRRWREAGASGGVDAATRDTIARFIAIYAGHIDTEEGRVYPAARATMDAAAQATMGAEMQARRRG